MDHCCVCERAKLRNRRVYSVLAVFVALTTGVAAVSAARHDWLALAGWGTWTLASAASLTFTQGWRMWCLEHQAQEHVR